jgi:hypothetical protein
MNGKVFPGVFVIQHYYFGLKTENKKILEGNISLLVQH